MVASITTYLLNFSALFASMALFFVPFVAVFAWRNRHEIKKQRPNFNYFMERFLISPESNALIFAWAASEAIVWYIIPEFLLVLVIFMKVHRTIDLIKYDLLGTIFGTIIALSWRMSDGFFLSLPYIRPRMLEQVQTWYEQHGIFGLFYQPFSGVPYKVFAHQADQFQFFIIWFIILAVIARMVRYVIAYQLTKALYPFVRPYVRKHYAILFVGAIAVFTFLLLHVVDVYSS